MKHICFSIILLLGTLLCASCTEDDETNPGFSFNITDDVVLTAEAGAETTISFTSELDWEAEVSAEWLVISPTEGIAGNNVITVTALSANDTDVPRIATLQLVSGDVTRSITIRQETSNYISLPQAIYQIEAEGGKIDITFSTSISSEKLQTIGYAPWIHPDFTSRVLTEQSVTLTIDPNEEVNSRISFLYFVKKEDSQRTILATVTIIQEGNTGSESTDFSKDGEVKVLQKATKGKGLPVILMGDGFIDAQIDDGTYDEVMKKAYENLFTEEPVKSLKNYFSVYSVTAVSKSNIIGYGYETAFNCNLEGEGSTLITGDNYAAISYTHCVKNIDYDKVLAIVILNTNSYAGTTYYGFTNPQMTEFAVAYCPIIKSLESEEFRQVLIHEAIGHGFAKLEDEYDTGTGAIPKEEKQEIQRLQSEYGWAQNVDFTNNENAVLWSRFLEDERYTDEHISIIEGACTYATGVFRPTEKSMMNENDTGFNAPSRKAIYDRVMKEGQGTEDYDYESFVSFDRQITETPQTNRSRTQTDRKRLPRPRFVGKPLHAK